MVLQVAMLPPIAWQLVELVEPFVPMVSQWVMPPPISIQVLVWAIASLANAMAARARVNLALLIAISIGPRAMALTKPVTKNEV